METIKIVPRSKKMNRRTALILKLLLCMAVIFGVLLWGASMDESAYGVNFADRNLAPSFQHWFGTDWMGRDMFSRSVKGMTTSIQIGLFASLISSIIAVILGILAATKGKKTDAFILWLVDLFQGKPHLFF